MLRCGAYFFRPVVVGRRVLYDPIVLEGVLVDPVSQLTWESQQR